MQMASTGNATQDRFAAKSFVEAYDALDSLAARGEGIALLHGAAGFGKTQLLRELAERQGPGRTAVFLYRGSQLSATSHGDPDLLLVDEADDMNAADIAELRRRRDGHGLTVIASTRRDLADALALGPIDAVVELAAFSDAEARAFASDLANWPFSAAALDTLVEAAAGSPRRIRSLVNVAGLEAELQESEEVDADIVAAALTQLTFYEGAKTGQGNLQSQKPLEDRDGIANGRSAHAGLVEGGGRVVAALPRDGEADRAASTDVRAPEDPSQEEGVPEESVPELTALQASRPIRQAPSQERELSQRRDALEDTDDVEDWQPDVSRWRPWQRVVAIGGSMLAGTAAAVLALMATGSPPFAAPEGLAAIFGGDVESAESEGETQRDPGATTGTPDETLAGLALDTADETDTEPLSTLSGEKRALAARRDVVPARRAASGGDDRASPVAEDVTASGAAGGALANAEPSSRPTAFESAPSAELAMNERAPPLSLRVPAVSVGTGPLVAAPSAEAEPDVATEDLRLAEESRRIKDRIRSLRY